MTKITLSDVPTTPTDVEDYVSALFRSAGWCLEANVVLRDDGVEILELDARAVQMDSSNRMVVLSESKSGTWGAPDLFKLYGWKSYLKADRAVFASTRRAIDVTDSHRRIAEWAGLTLLHLDDTIECGRVFEANDYGIPRPNEIDLWRLAALVERHYRAKIVQEVRDRIEHPGPKKLKDFHRLVGEQVLFIPDPAKQAQSLYDAHEAIPRLTLALACELDGMAFDPAIATHLNVRLQNALRTGNDLLLHCSMWVEYRSRLALLRAAVEMAIDQRKVMPTKGGNINWSFLILPASFHEGLEWLGKQPTFWRYPALWEQFCWTWGDFCSRIGMNWNSPR